MNFCSWCFSVSKLRARQPTLKSTSMCTFPLVLIFIFSPPDILTYTCTINSFMSEINRQNLYIYTAGRLPFTTLTQSDKHCHFICCCFCYYSLANLLPVHKKYTTQMAKKKSDIRSALKRKHSISDANKRNTQNAKDINKVEKNGVISYQLWINCIDSAVRINE